MKHFRDSWNEFQRHISLPPAYQGGREIQGLQILKFFCALMVVEIHFHSALHTMLNPLDRIAVPVFFMISGYFLPDAQGCISPARIERVFWKILRLTFWVNAIYFAYFFFGSIWGHGVFLERLSHMNFWVLWPLVGDRVGAHLWYLCTYLQTLLALWGIVKIWKRLPRWLFLLIPAGILFGLLLGRYSCFIEGLPNKVSLARNFITTGLPCVLLGILLRRGEGWLSMTTKSVLMAVLLIGVLQYAETILLYKHINTVNGDLFAFTIPWAMSFFLLALRFQSSRPWAVTLAAWGRKYSLDIYVWHIMVFGVLHLLSSLVGYDWPKHRDTLVIAVATLLFAMFLRYVQNKWQNYRSHGNYFV